MVIQYVNGDATEPIGVGAKIIVHIVNDLGAWGSGFVLAVSARWPEPKAAYVLSKERNNLKLGNVQLVSVESGRLDESIFVANLVGQSGLKSRLNPQPVQYPAVEEGLCKIAIEAKQKCRTILKTRP